MTKIHTCRDIPDELFKSLKKDGIAMIDCEFTGLDVGKSGTDRLCLIQICGKESKEIYLVQPNKNFETPNLVKVLNDPNIQIVVHFARKDKSAMENFLNPKCKITNLWDNKIASRCVRKYSQDQHSFCESYHCNLSVSN